MPPPDAIPAIQLQSVSCRVGNTQALANISLSLPAGARCVVVGPSGAGKTTLLRLLAGLHAHASGQLLMDGRDVASVPPEARSCGWVGADPGLLPHLDAIGQVELPLRLAGQCADRRRTLALLAMESVGMTHRLRHLPNQLSSGEALRVALARAIVNRPRLLLLDEPLARIDPAQRTALRRVIALLQGSSGCTVVEASHWIHDALPGASHLAILRRGQLVQVGEAASAWARPATPWTADFTSSLANWWSPFTERFRRGWNEHPGFHLPAAKLLGVRMDLASWHPNRPRGLSLGPLRVQQAHAVGLLAHAEASFTDGEVLHVPLRTATPPAAPGDVGWAGFGTEAVMGFETDDREQG